MVQHELSKSDITPMGLWGEGGAPGERCQLCHMCGGQSLVGFEVEVASLWGHWDNGGSKNGPHIHVLHMVWLVTEAFGGKPYGRVGGSWTLLSVAPNSLPVM